YLNKKRKDSHNLEKVLFDALMGAGLYPDDDILIPKTKNVYIDKYDPRVEVELELATKLGIFDNAEHLQKFKTKNCSMCKKSTYKKPCGVLNKALENRIEPELNLEKLECYNKKSV
ncbi:RusA family crossover junction endodeoxyribonuclease, partial [Romboutsia sp.]|uniref:RusA family crossover junction endodeoxyribonuclease n=1 Tax=Romboutsia sp. TaxID=1965302 RepID=UPI002D05653F